MKLWNLIFSFFISFFLSISMMAQDSVQVITVRDITPDANLVHRVGEIMKSFSFLPYYSSDIGAGAAVAYSKDSCFSFLGSVSTEGYCMLGMQGKYVTNGQKWRIGYNVRYGFLPTYYWGTGYTSGNDSGNRKGYDKSTFVIGGEFRYYPSKLIFFGPLLEYEYIGIGDAESANYLKGGFILGYDSRDNSSAATGGVYAEICQKVYSEKFGRTSILFDCYRSVWRGGVIAFDIFSEFTYGRVPWFAMPVIGGMERMRGYYKGRYRDNNSVVAQFEIRQCLYGIFSAAVWTGCGNVWGKGEKFRLNNTLPNYGVGARIKVNEGLSLRLDYGFGKKGQNGFILGINEAF